MQEVRVLLVEDDTHLAQAWSATLKRDGMVVDAAGTLADAQRFLRECPRDEPYDVMLLDMYLPDGHASAFLEGLRDRHATMSVAVLSGYLDADSMVTLYDQCAVAIPKPIGKHALIQLVLRLARNSALPDMVKRYANRHKLSPQEEQTILASAQGMGTAEAADMLGCSEGTVPTYWKRIYSKTGIRGRREVVADVLRFSVRGA